MRFSMFNESSELGNKKDVVRHISPIYPLTISLVQVTLMLHWVGPQWQERSVEKRPGPKLKRMYNQYNPLTLSQQFWYIFVLPFRA